MLTPIEGWPGRHIAGAFVNAEEGRHFATLAIAEPDMLLLGFHFVVELMINRNIKASVLVNSIHMFLKVL